MHYPHIFNKLVL